MANPFKDFTVRMEAGEPVYQEGEAGTMMYVIQSGAVELYRDVNGERISYGTLEKGDFFGEMSLLLERQPRTTSAVVLEDSNLVEIDARLFDKMIRGNIEIAVRMMRKLSIRLREYESEAEVHPAPAAMEAVAAQPAEAIAAAPPAPVAPDAPPPVEVVPPTPEAPAPEPRVSPPVAIPAAPEPPSLPVRRSQPSGSAPPRSLDQVRQQSPEAHAVFSSEDGSSHFPLEGPEAAIGRFDPVTGMRPEVDVSAIDINRSVSRHHARVARTEAGYTLTEEVGALNGTFINGKRLVTGEPTALEDGDEMGLGVVRLRFHVF